MFLLPQQGMKKTKEEKKRRQQLLKVKRMKRRSAAAASGLFTVVLTIHSDSVGYNPDQS